MYYKRKLKKKGKMKMYKRTGKRLLLGIMVLVMVVTSIMVIPTSAQAAKKEKRATIAYMYAYGDLALSTQEGYYEKKPYQISVKDAIVNRNKKAKYTFYSCNTKKIKVTKSGKITYVKGKDNQYAKVKVKETYKKKTRTVGTIQFILISTKILHEKVTWVVGKTYQLSSPDDEWLTEEQAQMYPEIPLETTVGYWSLVYDTEPVDAQETLKKLNGEIPDDTDHEDDNEYLTYNSKKNTYTVKKRGTLYFAFYAKNLKTDKFYYVGSFEARLVDSTEATDVDFEGWGMLDDDDGTEYISVGEKTTYWFDVVPYQYNGTVKVTCSDPKIATVKYKKDKDGANTVVVKGLKKGTVSITVEVNGAKVTKKLKVVNPDFFE